MHITTLYCLECQRPVKIEYVIPLLDEQKKLNVLKEHPKLLGLFEGLVMFFPEENNPCLEAEHRMYVRSGEPYEGRVNLSQRNLVKFTCLGCHKESKAEEEVLELFGCLCAKCIAIM